MLRAARLEAGLSQTELAERSGTSQATLSAYEHGHRNPSTETLARILAAAGRRLSSMPGRPVRSPGAAALERAGETLLAVLELAAELPTRHRPESDFPGLPLRAGGG